MEKLPSFWNFVTGRMALYGGYLPTICVDSDDEGEVVLTLLHIKGYGDRYYEWEYAYYVQDMIFGYKMLSMGRVILDFHRKTMIKQTILKGSVRRFRDIASLFFDDAAMYTDLPTLKSIAFEVVKTCNIRNDFKPTNAQACDLLLQQKKVHLISL